MGWNCSECGEKSYIYSNRRLTPKYKQMYTICRNPECQHKEVVDIQHRKTLSPPLNKRTSVDWAGFVSMLPADDKAKVLEALQE